MSEIKVFAMNECDWMASKSLESAVSEYVKNYSGGLPEDEATDNPYELTDEEMDRLKFVDDNVDPPAHRTFREHLEKLIAEGQGFPVFFASTEY